MSDSFIYESVTPQPAVIQCCYAVRFPAQSLLQVSPVMNNKCQVSVRIKQGGGNWMVCCLNHTLVSAVSSTQLHNACRHHFYRLYELNDCFPCRNADNHRLHHHTTQILQVTIGKSVFTVDLVYYSTAIFVLSDIYVVFFRCKYTN